MVRPKREPARNNQQTYFVTFNTAQHTPLFRHERWLLLLLNTMKRYAAEFHLHDYVVMEDHIHFLMTPVGALERPIQLIKGGFSFQARRQFSWEKDVWQAGFSDHRIRDGEDFEQHITYIRKNLEALREVLRAQRGRSGETTSLQMTPFPQRLNPIVVLDGIDGGTKVPLFQSEDYDTEDEASALPAQGSRDAEDVIGGTKVSSLKSTSVVNIGEQNGL